MARQQGWLRRKRYADGLTWLFCYQVTRPSDGKRVENSKRIGLVAGSPSERAAWMEVARLGFDRLRRIGGFENSERRALSARKPMRPSIEMNTIWTVSFFLVGMSP
jgi:hypothetical protein